MQRPVFSDQGYDPTKLSVLLFFDSLKACGEPRHAHGQFQLLSVGETEP